MKRPVATQIILALAFAVAMCHPVGRWLAFGWIAFAADRLARVTVSWPAVLNGTAIVLAFVGAMHGVGHWCYDRRSPPPEHAPRRWRLRWTLSALALAAVLFATAYSTMAVARQTGWLLLTP